MDPVRIGVVGCGAIAQIQHLPFLTELAEEFEVAAVCDASPSAVEHAAKMFHVPNRYTDYREMLDSDIDAVLMCHYDPKTEVVVASLEAGKHVFVEKPVCYSNEEFAEIAEAAQRSDKVAQAGYTKLYEPAYEVAKPEIASMDDIRYVQVNHLHPNNDLHVGQFRTRTFDDIPPEVIEKTKAARRQAERQAIGDVPASHPPRFQHGCGEHDPRPLRAARPVRDAKQGHQYGDMAGRRGDLHHAGVPGGR